MVQQMVDSKFNAYRLGTTEAELSTLDKQQVAVKKAPLRDVQYDSKTKVPDPIRNSPLSKDRGPTIDSMEISGLKRPSIEFPVNPPCHQAATTSANACLVYVRRKPEAELGKSGTCNDTGIKADCTHLRQPSVSPSLGKSDLRSAPAESTHSPASTTPIPVSNLERVENVNWEERFVQLQILLQRLDHSDHEDYLQILRTLSSVELSRHAVELEKRSIQLSLEEAKEMQRVGVLNVVGKAKQNLKELHGLFKLSSSRSDGQDKVETGTRGCICNFLANHLSMSDWNMGFADHNSAGASEQHLHHHPRKRRRPKLETTSKPKYSRKPNLEITPPCTECGKTFRSWKALFGHMRCHPERQWRGINPPPNHRRELTGEDHEVAASLLMLANGGMLAECSSCTRWEEDMNSLGPRLGHYCGLDLNFPPNEYDSVSSTLDLRLGL